MKRVTILTILCCFAVTLFADHDQQVIINKKGGHHYDFPAPAVQPEVYYDDVDQEIIIVGTGNATYYNVVIESVNDWDVSLSTQVNGSYDTIDISSLPADEYCITITTAWNDTFVGYFEIE
jgi:hypothetical protein